MDGQKKKQWGVTNPISEAHPSSSDLALNDSLIEALKAQNNFETPEGQNRRDKVVEEFVRRACKAKRLPASAADNAGGCIFTFGSYNLGVHGPTSDIDTLCVVPKHINMEDFFAHFPPTFKEMTNEEDITEFNPVSEAYVPIIKMEYLGVSIDLIFASLPTRSSVTSELKLTDKDVIRGLDDTGMRSVNGTRVSNELRELVPQIKAFRHATRAIKLWSNQRAIYGAVFGFPGGVAWAIMVARICQLYPFACGATVLMKFFNLMMKWPWPRPVMLKTIEESSLGLKVWNPQLYNGDRAHLMPVITPAFPSMCSTHTIMQGTMQVMMQEFKRADEIVGAIHAGKKSWSDLFERHTFFTKDHKYYLSVIAFAQTKDGREKLKGLVQSKVRLLAKGIEEGGEVGVESARPYIKAFERVHRCKNQDEIDRVKQGSMAYYLDAVEVAKLAASNPALEVTNGAIVTTNGAVTDIVKKDEEMEDREIIVYTSVFYIGLTLPPGPARSIDISFPVADFVRFVKGATDFDENSMEVRVVHTRNHDLPADVFQPGETRPEKKKKEKKEKKSSAKRPYAEAGLDDVGSDNCSIYMLAVCPSRAWTPGFQADGDAHAYRIVSKKQRNSADQISMEWHLRHAHSRLLG
ncbi:Poly(A) polymeras-like protein [Amniculicola lignicola CBS 123094]|uniref:Poly(A) polymerase n=1 Tax=Amniculicola lignicola CBS 123094 TaxID=1392246 RepID=A0A6A5W447_9PLEO|nr:Poly(A) polymeras-like protein [Amniculicola lignicola CBS 123094]